MAKQNESILDSIKKQLGIVPDYTVFDDQILLYINTAFSTLHQLGVGPEEGFEIVGKEDVIWCKSTDSAGFATIKPYRITEIEEPKVVDVKATEESPEYALKSDVDRIEEKIDKLLAELH